MNAPIAEITDYDSLIAAMRLRADQLQMCRENIDQLAGLPDRYSAKVLSRKHVKRLGMTSLGPLLAALGMKLLVVEDPETLERYRHQRIPRDASQVRFEADGEPIPKRRRDAVSGPAGGSIAT